MTQSNKFSSIQGETNKNLILNGIDQSGVRLSSNKLLSPFTWSNINIKLPKINKNDTNNYATIQQKPTNNKSKQLSKTKNKAKHNKNETHKLQALNKTIDFTKIVSKKQTKSQYTSTNKDRYRQRKQSMDTVNNSINIEPPKRQYIQPLDNPEKLKLFKKQLITRHVHKFKQPRLQEDNFNKTQKQIAFTHTLQLSRLRSPMSAFSQQQPSPQTFTYNKMQTYIYRALAKSNWCQIPQKDNNSVLAQLVWSDFYLDCTKLKPGQIHNHIHNLHQLTTKNYLHELESANGSSHYPQSFLMPFQYQNFCEQYEQNIVKLCLKQIIRVAYQKQLVDASSKGAFNLGMVLQQMGGNRNVNQDTLMALRLCLYLQNYRKSKSYRYFENSQQYVPIHTKIQPSVLTSLFKACYEYWQNSVRNLNNPTSSKQSVYFKVENIDGDIVDVLWGYHCMLLKFEQNYQNSTKRNMWIVKPIASSRGAGISLLKNSTQFLSINQDRFLFSNKSKFNNKIIQKYIQEPLLIKSIELFKDRKFDIRQWVLVTCDKQTNSPMIYVYEDAYCRFSDIKFTYNYVRSQQNKIHLTNYSVSDKSNPQNSLMILSQLFANNQFPDLKAKYYEQMNKIVVQTIMNAKDITFQKNKFQLLGYDVIFDANQKLWLLQINLNPACESSRSSMLQKMADKMICNMLRIVKAASGKICINKNERVEMGWNIVYGKQNFEQVDFQDIIVEPKIKPFYQLSLGNQSLIQQVRKRNFVMNAILKIVTISNLSEVFKTIKQFKPNKQQQNMVQTVKEQKQQNQQDKNAEVDNIC